jgi:predicted metal-binding membrane protein
MWSLMMAAMMLPTVHRVTDVYVTQLRRRTSPTDTAWRVVQLGLGYLLVWSAIGIPVYFIGLWTAHVLPNQPSASAWFSAALFFGSGAFQFSRIKERCLHHCQSPIGFVARYMMRDERFRELRAGIEHGIHCLGCCVAMVAVLVAVGTMNLPWMVLLGVVAMLEKTWRHGRRLSHVAGAAMMLIAAAIVLHPAWAPTPHGLEGFGAHSMHSIDQTVGGSICTASDSNDDASANR